MAQLGGTFDATNVPSAQDFETLPPGEYPVVIVKSDEKPNSATSKDPNGKHYVFEMDVIDGPMKGRKLWDRLNLVNANQTAREIAERQLSAMCHASGKMHVSDTAELHGIPMIAVVKVKPAEGNFKASNEVGTYKPMGAQPAAQPMQQGYQPAQPAPATNGAPPWNRAA